MTVLRTSRAVRRTVRGFSLITAIFLIVILAALGAFMVTFTSLQQTTVQADVLGVRAYYAARAGIDWALYRALDPENTIAPGAAAFAPCPVTTPTLTGLGGSLAPFSVTVTCTLTDASEGNRALRVFQIIATACNQASCPGTPAAGYVERRVTVIATRCKDPTAAAPRYACPS